MDLVELLGCVSDVGGKERKGEGKGWSQTGRIRAVGWKWWPGICGGKSGR